MRRGVTFADCVEEAGRMAAASGNLTSGLEAKTPDYTVVIDSPGPIQETPDYIRRGTEGNRIVPIDLFGERSDDGLKCDSGTGEIALDASPGGRRDADSSEAFAASFELGKAPERRGSLLSINAGDADDSVICGSVDFQKDGFYSGGDAVRTDATVGDGNGLALYHSARVGNFSYKFQHLEAGDYLVDLHFAEIVFVEGPRGIRVFDVFIQEQKVISLLDIYDQVGSNRPLILADLRVSAVDKEGVVIRFEGVVGQPILSAISIRYYTTGRSLQNEFSRELVPDRGKEELMTLEEEKCDDCKRLKRDYQLLLTQQSECKRAIKDLKKENELKSRECQDAWSSLRQLQMELMRKSMHVGSLAFAVEGQVKEKTRWFQSLAELSEKFQLVKSEYRKLSDDAVEFRKSSADIFEMSAAVQANMGHYNNLEKEHRDLLFKSGNEVKERKDLYNKVIELRGNIRVFCRCRPLNFEELDAGASMIIDFESAKDGELIVKGHVSSRKIFKFDCVFSPQENQDAVFEKTSPLATSVLDGYNVCIFAYGQTGTGKTFTMEGTEEARGVNYRTLEELFRIIKERQGLFTYEVTVSGLEVYNEQIRDLLLASGAQPGSAAKRLEVRQVAEGVHHVPGLVEAHVSNTNEAWEVLQTGSKARVVGSTCANEHSSRSHCIHCVMVKGENLMNGECTRSKLWLIDLAGSERVAKTDAQGDRLKEAQSINKSLSALGGVISALTIKSTHVPFRNSKLTHLLQDSLGGDSKVLMFVQISPNKNDVGETLCSLNFASRVRGVELGPAKRQVDIGEILRYKRMVGKAKEDGKQKETQIKRMEETIQSLEMKNKTKDFINKNLQDKIKELESQLLIERKLARQHVDTKIAEHQLHQKQQQQQQLEETNENASIMRTADPMSEKNHTLEEEDYLIPFKELMNVMQPIADDNSSRTKQHLANDYKHFPSFLDKENKPELAAEETALPRRTGRVSHCPTTGQIPLSPAPRRNSLIPLPPSRRNSLIPLPTAKAAASRPILGHITENLSTTTQLTQNTDTCEVEIRSQPRSTRKVNSIIRRSLQKKVIIRPQLQQTVKRANTLAGHDTKLRVSLGGSARKAKRVVAGNGPNGDRMQHRQHNREKERGWNNGTTVRNIF